jgi:hypothetical protein
MMEAMANSIREGTCSHCPRNGELIVVKQNSAVRVNASSLNLQLTLRLLPYSNALVALSISSKFTLTVCVEFEEFEKIEGRGIICTRYRRIRCGVHLDDGNDKHCNNDRFVFFPIGVFNDLDFDGLLLR